MAFVNLDTATKIALVNANYRGEFRNKGKFKSAITNGLWANALGMYLSHPDYKENKCNTTGKGSICKRMKWNAEQFKKHIKPQGIVIKMSYSFKDIVDGMLCFYFDF
jgi:hypothetical protein